MVNVMPDQTGVDPAGADPAGQVFAALADPTRRALLQALTAGPQTVSQLAGPLPMSLVAVAKHLIILERAGIVSRARHGRTVVCTLDGRGLATAATWLDHYRQFWDARLDELQEFLTMPPTAEST